MTCGLTLPRGADKVHYPGAGDALIMRPLGPLAWPFAWAPAVSAPCTVCRAVAGLQRLPPLPRCTVVGYALVAQLVEHVLGKDGVTGSNPVEGSN